MCAALTGLGGGNYAASLANVNAFYPQRLKGAALAINAGVGNLGVAVIQLVGLLVLATAGHEAPYWVCAVYLVLLAIVGIAAALFMDNLDHGIELSTHAFDPVRARHLCDLAALHLHLRLLDRVLPSPSAR